MQRIRDNYATSRQARQPGAGRDGRRLARIQPVDGYDDIADCDVVIEAVFEEMDVKKPVFAKLDAVDEAGRAAVLQHLGARHRRDCRR